jgi:hypothetical protein
MLTHPVVIKKPFLAYLFFRSCLHDLFVDLRVPARTFCSANHPISSTEQHRQVLLGRDS